MQTFEDTIYQFIAYKNRVIFAFNSDNQRMSFKSVAVRLNDLCFLQKVMKPEKLSYS